MATRDLPPEQFIEFVLKLSSEGSGLERQAAVESVTTQLRNYEQNPAFKDVFTELDPDNLHETTKTMPEYQRDILTEAIQVYCNS